MARKAAVGKSKKRSRRTGRLTILLMVVLLVSIGGQLHRLHGQVVAAQSEREQLAAQVEAQQRENDALSSDIAQSGSQEKIEEIARDELGLVAPGERVFYDVSN